MSLVRAAVGFVVAFGLAVGIGLSMAVAPRVRTRLDPIVETLRPVSSVALVPLAIVWFGPGPLAPISIVVYAAFFPALLNTIAGVRSVDPVLVAAARTLGIGSLAIARHVLLPGALPAILVGGRLAMGNAWRSLILAELLVGARSAQGVSGGIGALMFWTLPRCTVYITTHAGDIRSFAMSGVARTRVRVQRLLRGAVCSPRAAARRRPRSPSSGLSRP